MRMRDFCFADVSTMATRRGDTSLLLFVRNGLVSRRNFSSTSQKKVPRRRGEYLFGVAPCMSALTARRRQVFNIFLKTAVGSKTSELKSTALNEVKRYAEMKKMEIHYVTKKTLERMSSNRPHQGIVLDVSPLTFTRMDASDCQLTEDCSTQGPPPPPVWLALDKIQDPMNFGAILRAAFFLGAQRVIATSKNCCSLTPVVSKASSGAMETMTVFSLSNMPGFLSLARSQGWEVIGTCSPEVLDEQSPLIPGQDVANYSLHKPTILVLGNEGYGIRKELSLNCSTLLTIPPHRPLPPGFDSLNVGVAAGIILHKLVTTYHQPPLHMSTQVTLH